MRSDSTYKLRRKRGIHLSRREKVQLVILAVALVIILAVAMVIGARTTHI